MAEVRLGGDDDSPALSTLLANDSRAGGAAKPGDVPGVVMEVERRNLEAAAARAAAAPFAAFFAPFCLPLFVISTSCNTAKGFVITTSSSAEITTFCRLKKAVELAVLLSIAPCLCEKTSHSSSQGSKER